MDLNLNHSGDILEDLLGNDRETTIALRDAFKNDSKARFRLTAIIGGLLGGLGIMFTVLLPFIPIVVDLWLMGMAVGMFLAGLFGMLFSMPVTDSVAVHLKVINYVDNVIKNSEYKRPDLLRDHELPDPEYDTVEPTSEEDEDEEEQGYADEDGTHGE